MANRTRQALADPEVRRVFEEELLVGEATDTAAALLESLGISQRELAERLSVSPGRVSQILSGEENLTLRSLGALGWALGVRFDLSPTPMEYREGTPAVGDPPAPAWLKAMGKRASLDYGWIELPSAERLPSPRPSLRVVKGGEVKAA